MADSNKYIDAISGNTSGGALACKGLTRVTFTVKSDSPTAGLVVTNPFTYLRLRVASGSLVLEGTDIPPSDAMHAASWLELDPGDVVYGGWPTVSGAVTVWVGGHVA